jgi:hypothetical protein
LKCDSVGIPVETGTMQHLSVVATSAIVMLGFAAAAFSDDVQVYQLTPGAVCKDVDGSPHQPTLCPKTPPFTANKGSVPGMIDLKIGDTTCYLDQSDVRLTRLPDVKKAEPTSPGDSLHTAATRHDDSECGR